MRGRRSRHTDSAANRSAGSRLRATGRSTPVTSTGAARERLVERVEAREYSPRDSKRRKNSFSFSRRSGGEEWRELSKLLNTYLGPLPALIDEQTGRLRGLINQTVAATELDDEPEPAVDPDPHGARP